MSMRRGKRRLGGARESLLAPPFPFCGLAFSLLSSANGRASLLETPDAAHGPGAALRHGPLHLLRLLPQLHRGMFRVPRATSRGTAGVIAVLRFVLAVVPRLAQLVLLLVQLVVLMMLLTLLMPPNLLLLCVPVLFRCIADAALRPPLVTIRLGAAFWRDVGSVVGSVGPKSYMAKYA